MFLAACVVRGSVGEQIGARGVCVWLAVCVWLGGDAKRGKLLSMDPEKGVLICVSVNCGRGNKNNTNQDTRKEESK